MNLKIKILALVVCIVFSTVSAMAAECDCIVDSVANMGNRVHVHCEEDRSTYTSAQPFPFFALPLDSPLVNTFVIMAQTTMNENRFKVLTRFCARDSQGGDIGCDKGGDEAYAFIMPVNAIDNPIPLHISYDESDTSGTSFGCMADSCRKPTSFYTDWT